MILRTRTWKGGSTYEVTALRSHLLGRLPLPGEDVVLGDMGRVRVMSGHEAKPPGALTPAFASPRTWRLVVQTPNIGPSFDDL